MSILNPNNDPATLAANQILQLVRQPFVQMRNSGLQGYNLIWNNRNVSPQDVIAALGTNAKAVFEFAQLNIATIDAAATIDGTTPPVIPEVPAQYTLTFNDDGSANLIQNSSSSSSSGGASSSSSSGGDQLRPKTGTMPFRGEL